VILVDVNVLIYAVDNKAAHHQMAKNWWESALFGDEVIGLPWLVVLGFIRVTTMPQAFFHPFSVDKALEIVQEWLAHPLVSIVHPGPQHFHILQNLLMQVGTGGNLTSDAHLAAVALETHAKVISFDRDFARFPGLQWRNPAAHS
jgi:toxin-antitoxin system PIN domain toxin